VHFVSKAWVLLKKTTGLLFPWRYIFTESWEGDSLPTLFFIRAYGQTFKICHHQLFLEAILIIFQLAYSFKYEIS